MTVKLLLSVLFLEFQEKLLHHSVTQACLFCTDTSLMTQGQVLWVSIQSFATSGIQTRLQRMVCSLNKMCSISCTIHWFRCTICIQQVSTFTLKEGTDIWYWTRNLGMFLPCSKYSSSPEILIVSRPDWIVIKAVMEIKGSHYIYVVCKSDSFIQL